MSCWLFLLPLIVTSQQPEWDLSQKVTYTTVARSAKNVCADLTKLTKVPLEASSEAASEALVIDVHDVSLRQLMDKIATVTSAKWEKGKEYIALKRPSEIDLQERQADVAFMAKGIRTTMDEFSKRALAYKRDDENGIRAFFTKRQDLVNRMMTATTDGEEIVAQIDRLDRNTPTGKLLDRLVSHLDPTALASMRIQERIVYSTHPNRLQRRFPSEANAAFDDFIADWKLWSSMMTKTQTDNLTLSEDLDQSLKSGYIPEKVVLSCAWEITGDRLRFKLYAISAKNDILVSKQDYVRAVPLTEKPWQTGSKSLMKWSALAQEWSSDTVGRRIGDGEPIYVSSDLANWISRPDQNDPLSLHPSEVVRTAAQERKCHLVANLPDRAIFSSIITDYQKPITVDQCLDSLQQYGEVQFEEKEGWLLVTPRFPWKSRTERLNRMALRQTVVAQQTRNVLSLDDLAGFVTQNSREALNLSLLTGHCMLWLDSSSKQTIDQPEFLRLYKSLSADQKRTLHQEGIPIASFGPMQLAQVSSMVYEDSLFHNYIEVASRSSSVFESAYREPTEAFPNGIPTTGQVKLDMKRTQPVAIDCQSATRQVLSAEMLVKSLFREPVTTSTKRRPNSFVFGSRSSGSFTISVLPEFTMSGGLFIVTVDPGQTPRSIEQMPDALREEVNKDKQRLK